jgi:hypothetical protein
MLALDTVVYRPFHQSTESLGGEPMQPCPNCGRTELTPAGNCQNCGMFRGNEGYNSGYPPANPYQGQQGYQGQPYQQPYQQPYAAQQPQQPHQYGGGGYQPVQPARRPSTVPLIVLSVVAVILVIGIVSVVVIRAGQDDDPGGNGGTGTAAGGIDKCVLGTWRVTSAKEKVDMDGTLTEFKASGGSYELKEDGTGTANYGQGVTYTGTYLNQTVTITFVGKSTFSYKTNDGSFTFSNPKSEGTATVKVNGSTTTSIPLDLDTKPAKYTCSANKLTQSTDLATVELSK